MTRYGHHRNEDTILRSYSESGKQELRVAFIVNNRNKENIIDCTPINGRICTLRLKTKFFNLSFINAHAETEDKEEITKKEFYQRLERAYDSISTNNVRVVLGDLNAKIGKEPVYKQVAGNQSLHKTNNNNGQRVVDTLQAREI